MDGFSWNLIFEEFSNICRENSSFIKIGQEQRILTWRPMYILIISRSFLLRITNVVEKIKTNILFPVTIFENHAICKIMWKNSVEPGRPQMTVWYIHIACRITKATRTHTHTYTINNTYCFSTTTMVTRMRLIVSLYVHYLTVLLDRTDPLCLVGGSCVPCWVRGFRSVRNTYVSFFSFITSCICGKYNHNHHQQQKYGIKQLLHSSPFMAIFKSFLWSMHSSFANTITHTETWGCGCCKGLDCMSH
jgi:hypothetical protein